jgi:phospholipase C
MSKIKLALFLMLFAFCGQSYAGKAAGGKFFNRAIYVIFENTNYVDALKQPFFNKLSKVGANFTNIMAIRHPSQPNYIALTSGSDNGVSTNNSVNLNVNNIIDLLEAKGISWKVYAEDFPGNCFTGNSKGNYVRKHNPFISYLNIQKNSNRCANIVNANQFDQDVARNSVPSYVFYLPNMKNSGHDTNVTYADNWYGQKFEKYLNDKKFMQDTVLISTFDESGNSSRNQIYTTIVGPAVKAGDYANDLSLYSLLNLVERNWTLGFLTKQDAGAPQIPNIWK